MIYTLRHVFLLAGVLASYRMKSNESSGIDPIHCISSPGLSDRTMLKLTNIKIRLITDCDVYLIIKKGIRGGRCEAIYYRAKANNILILILTKKLIKNHISLVLM